MLSEMATENTGLYAREFLFWLNFISIYEFILWNRVFKKMKYLTTFSRITVTLLYNLLK